jgi:hypothetical protein
MIGCKANLKGVECAGQACPALMHKVVFDEHEVGEELVYRIYGPGRFRGLLDQRDHIIPDFPDGFTDIAARSEPSLEVGGCSARSRKLA